MTERTLALIKNGPIGRKQILPIISRISALPLKMVARRGLYLTREQAATFYNEHHGRPYFDRLMASVTGPEGVVAMILEGRDAVKIWRDTIGPSDPVIARAQHPLSLRARFGTELPDNAVHGSDSLVSAEWEIGLLFETACPPAA